MGFLSLDMAGALKLQRDQYLFKEGEEPDAMYVVKSGRLLVTKNKQNSEFTLAELGPGTMVGEMAFFDNKPRSANVKAAKDSEVIALPYKALHLQFATFPEWVKAIMRTVNDHLRNANKRLQELEKNPGADEELFPPHTITKTTAIINFVAHKFATPIEGGPGLKLDYARLRNYTIQIFQEPTHKMDKALVALQELGFLDVEDLGEGRKRIHLFKPELLFDFTDWYNDWLFKEKNRVTVKEEELKLMQGVTQFIKNTPKDEKGRIKLSLTDLQNDSMRELGYLIKIEDVNPLIANKLMSEPMMQEGGGVFSFVEVEELERLVPFWSLIYAFRRITR